MDRINGNINQSIKILELSSGIARSIFNVPEGFSLIGQHEDGISPYQFDFDINNKGVIRIYLYKQTQSTHYEVNVYDPKIVRIDLKGKVLSETYE